GQPVADALFGTPFSGDDGTFQGCTRRQSQTIFDCRYEQPSAQYVMTAQADAANSFKIVEITITSSG
ncbi:MAG: hypothetical protein QOH79_461, partial [Acidimicrobiaceae bacterium]